MGRRIVTTQYQSRVAGEQVDTYFDKVIKYIPADIVSAWVTVTGLIKSNINDAPINSGSDATTKSLLWICFVAGAVLTTFWTLKQTEVPNKPPAYTQAAISTSSFVIWVFALGGPFATLDFYKSLYGSLLLVFYTLVVGLINPPEK